MASNLRTIVSGIKDKNILRAVERRFYDYLRSEKGVQVANKIKPMSDSNYAKYADEVEELLKGSDWKSIIDDMFGL